MKQLNFNTNIFIGENSLDCLKTYSNERIFIVTDGFLVESKLIDFITDNINDTNTVEIYTDVVPDPVVDNVVGGVEKLDAFKPTLLIAFGGGSAIDAAKAMKLFGIKLGKFEQLTLIVIPTTSGTGSEVTNFSVITNPKENLKHPLVDDLLQPDKAILDTRLVRTVPPHITADTGMDVLTHALEAYVSTEANDFSDALAEKAISLILNYLERAFVNGDDMEAREKVHYASCLAGIAFNQASLGLCHGIAHTIGGKFHMPHGRINAILLPSIIEFNSEKCNVAMAKYADIAQKNSLSTGSGKMAVRQLVNRIKKLRQALDIPSNFVEMGETVESLKPHLDTIGKEAIQDPTTATNPIQPTEEEVIAIIEPLFKK
ncbi:1-propanol dehydrogenase PduQ [Vagococcus fessus]|uniref:Alcohol dehydrogenase n=1 Tax=Vagococcus fessus TaxID=120370 RepID=A0A430AC62_9ENTE|nr:1-propanol dehydrogenase PduQ [Vagococcus fessus]RSU04804.1 alcohol dehydrogenase [Vagococcus fessus]